MNNTVDSFAEDFLSGAVRAFLYDGDRIFVFDFSYIISTFKICAMIVKKKLIDSWPSKKSVTLETLSTLCKTGSRLRS